MSSAVDIDRDQCNSAGEERVLLVNVSWKTYQQLLADLASQSSPRLTYDKGMLEIMSPGPLHERLKRLIETIVERYAEESQINIYCLGSTTFKRKIFERGFEPDSCFYIRNEARVRGKDKLNLRRDPPPDLVIEIDITGTSIDKFSIFAQMLIPEVWVHDGSKLSIYTLQEESYKQSTNSLSLPSITSARLSEFIQQTVDLPSTEFLKALLEWIKRNRTQPG